MRVAANIVLLKYHAVLHEHQKMLELSWSKVVCVNSLIECLNGTLESVAP